MSLMGDLRKKVEGLDVSGPDLGKGYLPFVIVVKKDVIPTEIAMERVDFNDNPGFVNLTPNKVKDFKTISSVSIPDRSVYLLVDIDRGQETINVVPTEALVQIEKQKRSPLTIDEGVAIITHFPDFLQKNNCFSLLGSRAADKRVPAIWISEGKPRLGWCWAGNPHTWLGSASGKSRID